MKKLAIVFLVLIMSLQSFAQHSDEEAIKQVIQTAYVEGLQNEGDLEKIDSGIHPGFNLLGIGKSNPDEGLTDQMWNLSIDDWKQKTQKRKEEGLYPRTGKDQVSIKFLNIDITGTAAVAKIEFYVGDEKTFVDYISLYKFDSGWKMVNKIFYRFPDKK
jgi:hypothetical protein